MPVDPATLLAFMAASVLVYAMPGPDMAYIAANALEGGRRQALLAATGTVLGVSGHALAAVLGLSALVAASATAFEAIRWAGVAYLVWLGLAAWRGGEEATPRPAPGGRRVVARGAAINLLNPKIALFFLAFLPQFAHASAGPLGPQLATLAGLFLAGAAVACGGLALAFAWLGGRIGGGPRVRLWRGRVAGTAFLGFAVALALGGEGRAR